MFHLLDRLAARLLRSDSDDVGCLLGLCLLPGWPFGALLTFLRASFRPPAGRWHPHGSAGKCFIAYSLLCGGGRGWLRHRRRCLPGGVVGDREPAWVKRTERLTVGGPKHDACGR
jgi:hypothetical protein